MNNDVNISTAVNINTAKNINNFSFIEQLFDKIINSDFKSNSYRNYNNIDLSTNGLSTTSTTNIYNSISAIGEDITLQIYNEILNYVDNITNIDLCKVKALQSFTKLLAIDSVIFKNIDIIPIDILNIIDIMSINPTYLIKSDKFNKKFQEQISSEIEVSGVIYKSNLQPIISSLFYNNITSVLSSTYTYPGAPYIYNSLSNNIQLSTYTVILNESDEREANNLKNNLNIPISFNQVLEADNIYYGKTELTDYTLPQQSIINLELERRSRPININYPQSRYSYYLEKKFLDYYQFIQYQYSQTLSLDTIFKRYDIDNNYFELSGNNISSLLTIDSNNTLSFNDSIINCVVNNLVYITNEIYNIREQIKVQAQKNFMRGTFNLLSYVIKLYIYQLLRYNISNEQSINFNDITVDLIEYNDITQYFNISTDIIADLSDSTLNQQYWNTTKGVNILLPFDNNNIFNINIADNAIYGNIEYVSELDIKDFYFNVLNAKTLEYNNINLFNFLSTVYACGAEKIYLSKNDNNEPIINYTDISGFIHTVPISGELSNELDEYKRGIFLNYSGDSIANTPFFYTDNIKHPSYQLHSYIKNFVEKIADQYPIQNITQIVDNTISTKIIQNIDNYIDDNGYILNAYNIYTNTFSDYVSKYELKPNINLLNQADPVVEYTGLFYPDAITDLIDNKDNFLNRLSSNECTNRWYLGLNLSLHERINIATKINNNFDILNSIATNDDIDIYKYAEDILGTQYFLLKKYSSKNISSNDKHNTSGILFVKPKNFPIALPAFVYYYNEFDKNRSFFDIEFSKNINIKFNDVDKHSLLADTAYTYPKIFDFDLDISQQYIIFQSVQIDEKIDIITYVDKEFNNIENRTLYFLKYPTKKDAFGNKDESGSEYIGLSANNYMHLKNICINNVLYSIYANIDNNCIYFRINTFDCELLNDNTFNNEFNISSYFPPIAISDCVFDITTTGNATLAYVNEIDSISAYTNYLGIEYEKDSNLFNQFDEYIIAHNFILNNMSLVYDNTNIFNTHTQMGFIPIVVNEINNISETVIVNEQSVEKIQILGDRTDGTGIDFKFTMPLRAYKNNASSLSDLEHLYFDENSNISTTYMPLKSDEGYIEDRYTNFNKLNFITTDCHYTTNEYIQSANASIELSNTAILNIVTDNNMSACQLLPEKYSLSDNVALNQISVQWYQINDSIKLDFNAYFAKYANDISIDNYRNNKHLFLNLDKPGDAGYLNVFSKYNEDEQQQYIEQLQQYYIKNISDTVPKFMISAMFNNATNYNITMLSVNTTDDNGILAINDNGLISYIGVE